MSFLWPTMLWCLLLVPVGILLYRQNQRRRRQRLALYGTLGIVRAPAGRALGGRRHLPALCFLLGLTILLAALARPEAAIRLPRLEGTVILAFDVSGSMAADDLEPTRMEAAKAAARVFVERQPSTVQIGVVAFSDSGFAVQPPTNDHEAIFASIRRLAPERGTSLAHGIVASLNAIFVDPEPETRLYSSLTPTPSPSPTPLPEGVYTPAVILLLTDGENTAPEDPYTAAEAAADRGVRIYPIGLGSAAGVPLEVEGFTVHTRLDEAMLQQLATLTDGIYYNAADEEELLAIYESLEPALVVKTDELEVTALFATAGLLLLLTGGIMSLLWFGHLP